jgi:hypothetical protein
MITLPQDPSRWSRVDAVTPRERIQGTDRFRKQRRPVSTSNELLPL